MRTVIVLLMILGATPSSVGADSTEPAVTSLWQRLLLDADRDLRLKALAVDADGGILLVHTVRPPGAPVIDGELAVWRIHEGEERRATIEVPAPRGPRLTAYDGVPVALHAGELALAVRTSGGIALVRLDGDSLVTSAARHRQGGEDPLHLEPRGAGSYRLMTSRGVLSWPAEGEAEMTWRLAADTHAVAATGLGDSMAVIAVRSDARGGQQPLAGLVRDGRYGSLAPADARVRVAPGRAPLLASPNGVELIAPETTAGSEAWWRLRFDDTMALIGSDGFELPFERAMRTGFGVLVGDIDGLVATGGTQGYWIGRVGEGGAQRLPMDAEPPVAAAWVVTMDLRTAPGMTPGTTLIAATYAYPDVDAERVRYGLHLQLVALQDGGDAHAAGGAHGD